LLVLVAFVTRALFVYRTGAPEPDTVAMVAGMAMGMSGTVSAGDALLYGRSVNPGMHLIAVRIFPLFLAPPHVMSFLNWLTVGCAALVVIPFYGLIRPHLGHRTAISCVAVWLFTPIVWESGTFYHPLVPALFLLLLAVGLARRISATANGVVAFVVVALLASLAFLVRVEVVFVWPGLLAWTLASRRRWRDTSILLVVSMVATLVYLLGSRALTSSTGNPTPVGFVRSTTGLYTSTFNLHGLPRSATWMVLGMGVMTLAACAWGWLQRPGGSTRLLAAAMAWSLPSMIFWLPQPTPIDRHYLLATIGIVVILGVVLFSRLSARRLMAVVIAIAALNLGVPDIAYRAYNAVHAGAPKTAHGSFFYYHSMAARQIEKDARDAQRIATCSTSRTAESSPRSCALVRWEELAHVAYALSVSGRRVTPEPITTVFPGVRDVRFKVDNGEVRLISYAYFENQVLRERVSTILRESQRDGYCLFAPKDLLPRVPELQMLGSSVQGY
jgi:hypothetical protein